MLTLALGLGANAAVFSLIDALLVRPLAVHEPSRLVHLTLKRRDTFGSQRFDLIRSGTRTLSALVGAMPVFGRRPIEFERGDALDLFVHAVTPDYFAGLGVVAMQGRLFRPGQVPYEAPGAAVISEAFWRRHFRGAGGLGARFRYASREFTIVGIAPPAFHGVQLETPADIWVSITQTEPPDSLMWTRASWLIAIGRLAPGMTRAQVAAEATALAGAEVAVADAATGLSSLRADFARPLIVVQLITGLVLLIACGNLINLMLARAASRDREIAIRLSVGASRGRLVRQFTTESLLLTAAGALLGLVVAHGLTTGLLAFLPPAHAGASVRLGLQLSMRLVILGGVVLALATAAFGLLPALRATRAIPSAAPGGRANAGGAGARMPSRLLIVAQVALCTVLLVGAGLFIATFRGLWRIDAGFDARGLIAADVETRGQVDDRVALYDALRERILAVPGVNHAGYTRIGQMTGGAIEFTIVPAGQPARRDTSPSALEQRISPGFLEAMRTALRSGRLFDGRDTPASPAVAVVNEAFARAVFPGDTPLGRRFDRDGVPSPNGIEVVGLVEDSKWADLREAPLPMFYLPTAQSEPPAATFAVRVDGDVGRVLRLLPDVARSVDSRIRLRNVSPFTEVVNRTILTERMVAWLSAGFAGLAVLIASIGLYGVLSNGVARRTQELGVRMALGATRRAVRWMIVRESLTMLAAGVAIGMATAAAGAQYVASMLFGVAPHDAATFASALAVISTVLIAASWIPARRATRVDPIVALRAD